MRKPKRQIAYITGTRADFGLMTPILNEVQRSASLQLTLYATGMHLMPEYGRTIRYVREAFPNVRTLNATFPVAAPNGLAIFASAFVPKIIRSLTLHRPDLVLVLGDRVEMLCVALACTYLNIPLAHVHGGEKTSTVDDTARHALSKLAHIHFPATRVAANRLRAMGEEPWRIHTVGAPGLDAISHSRLPSRRTLFKSFRLNPNLPLLLVTQHPVTESVESAGEQMEETLSAVEATQMQAVVTYPNADPGSAAMLKVITKRSANPQMHIVRSLPYVHFLTLEREAAVWIGNSSAGVIESASFRTPVINVGNRQRDREHSANVLHVPHQRKAIVAAVAYALGNPGFKRELLTVTNVWGDGKTGRRVRRILESLPFTPPLLHKKLTYV